MSMWPHIGHRPKPKGMLTEGCAFRHGKSLNYAAARLHMITAATLLCTATPVTTHLDRRQQLCGVAALAVLLLFSLAILRGPHSASSRSCLLQSTSSSSSSTSLCPSPSHHAQQL